MYYFVLSSALLSAILSVIMCMCRLQTGIRSSSCQRSSTWQSGGEAAERQGSAPGSQEKLQFSSNTSRTFHFSSPHLYSCLLFFSSGKQCVCKGCDARGRECCRWLCGASEWKPRGPSIPVGGPVHEPGGGSCNVWWGKGSQVRENHKVTEPVDVESFHQNCTASLCYCCK